MTCGQRGIKIYMYTYVFTLKSLFCMSGIKRLVFRDFVFHFQVSYGNTKQRRDFALISKGTTLFKLSLSTNGATTLALDKVPTAAPFSDVVLVKCHSSH